MRKIRYELKRLPDVNGHTNWILSQVDKDIMPHRFVSWNRAYIEEEVMKLKVGEIKIIEV